MDFNLHQIIQMTYHGFVICNCYQNGFTEKPPHEQYVVFNDDGLDIEIPNEIFEKEPDRYFEMDQEFRWWKEESCDHIEMELCSEFLGGSSEVYAFNRVVNILGADKYPILSRLLPP